MVGQMDSRCQMADDRGLPKQLRRLRLGQTKPSRTQSRDRVPPHLPIHPNEEFFVHPLRLPDSEIITQP